MSMNGSMTVGYTCCYVPVEVVMAAGFTPRRLIPHGKCADADSRIYPNTCCYVKSLFADALGGAFSDMDAVILANSCDAMRKLYDLWIACIKKPVALFMDIPKRRDADSIIFFTSELRRLASQLEGLSGGSPVTSEGLGTAIKQMNDLRSAWMELYKALKNHETPIRGSDVFTLMHDESALDPSGLTDKITGFLQAHTGKTSAGNSKKILVTGNIMNNPELVFMIEAAGGAIAGFDTCFGMRHYELMVEEGTTDPLEALARRYLLRPQCARMMGIADQIDYLKKAIEATKADGVIVSTVKFCDNLTYNVPTFQEAVAATGARCLVLENDYEFSDIEKARIKAEAFLEMLD
jgi:benzoyl-CoA reductase/2-hydroxyglutaryl-CoA dehydratase subunit BcrC/BadD/HgdB